MRASRLWMFCTCFWKRIVMFRKTFSIIWIYGDWDVDVRHLISFSVFHSLVALDEWTDALSCWNKYSSFGKWRTITGHQFFFQNVHAVLGIDFAINFSKCFNSFMSATAPEHGRVFTVLTDAKTFRSPYFVRSCWKLAYSDKKQPEFHH